MKNLLSLVNMKSLITLAMTAALIAQLFLPVNPNPEAQSLFCTAYGAIIAYFFTKRSTASSGEQTGQSKEKQDDNGA